MKSETRTELKKMLERHEGYKRHAYSDSLGIQTIGIGRNLENRGLDHDEALFLLNNDIANVETDIRRIWPFFDNLSETRKIVILNMGFQLGVRGLMLFTRMLMAIEDGDFNKAGEEMLASRWREQTPGRAFELAQIMVRGAI